MAGSQFPTAQNLVAGDFNKDGKIDLATVNSVFQSNFQFTVGIFLGNGDGTFSAGQRYGSVFGTSNIGTTDLDGDGNSDLVVGFADPHGFGPSSGSASYVYFLLGRGDGTFAGSVSYDTPAVASNIDPSFAVADFNGDQKLDIATTTIASGLSLDTLTGNGDGTFTPGTTVPISVSQVGDAAGTGWGSQWRQEQRCDCRDHYAQCDDDAGAAADLAVFLGNGNDTFGSEMDTVFDSTVGALVAGDFNNDKVLDVIAGGLVTTDNTGNPASGAVFYLQGKNNGSFGRRHR